MTEARLPTPLTEGTEDSNPVFDEPKFSLGHRAPKYSVMFPAQSADAELFIPGERFTGAGDARTFAEANHRDGRWAVVVVSPSSLFWDRNNNIVAAEEFAANTWGSTGVDTFSPQWAVMYSWATDDGEGSPQVADAMLFDSHADADAAGTETVIAEYLDGLRPIDAGYQVLRYLHFGWAVVASDGSPSVAAANRFLTPEEVGRNVNFATGSSPTAETYFLHPRYYT